METRMSLIFVEGVYGALFHFSRVNLISCLYTLYIYLLYRYTYGMLSYCNLSKLEWITMVKFWILAQKLFQIFYLSPMVRHIFLSDFQEFIVQTISLVKSW